MDPRNLQKVLLQNFVMVIIPRNVYYVYDRVEKYRVKLKEKKNTEIKNCELTFLNSIHQRQLVNKAKNKRTSMMICGENLNG